MNHRNKNNSYKNNNYKNNNYRNSSYKNSSDRNSSYWNVIDNYNENRIPVLIQAFYGNRTVTFINPDHFDGIMLGYLNHELFEKSLDHHNEKIDRTIVRLPGTDNLVLVYNKYQEEKDLNSLQEFIQELRRTESRYNPTAVIPELGLVLYSRCIVCRMNENGELSGIEAGDPEKAMKYLAQ